MYRLESALVLFSSARNECLSHLTTDRAMNESGDILNKRGAEKCVETKPARLSPMPILLGVRLRERLSLSIENKSKGVAVDERDQA